MPSSNRPRPAYRRARHKRSNRGPLILAAIGLVAVVVIGVSMLGSADAADNGTQVAGATVAATTLADGAAAHDGSRPCVECHDRPKQHFEQPCDTCHEPSRPFKEPQLSHVTFGAHTQATQACSTCHPAKPNGEIACRACHGSKCGKDAKTAADCLACHDSGFTDEWIPASE